MFDQRKEPRKKLIAFAPVFGLRPRILLGYLVDLTAHGAKVEGEHSAEVDKQLYLAIEFPGNLPEIPASPFIISARVTRCSQSETPHYFTIGFEFNDLAPEQTRVIEAIIQRYAFRQMSSE